MKKSIIAILGSTSHIAKGLIYQFLWSRGFKLHLFTRSPNRLRGFLGSVGKSTDHDYVIHEGYDDFIKCHYDVLINCVGVGTWNKHLGDFTAYFTVTEKYDNLAIRYLCDTTSAAIYISLSSGAIYGNGHSAPVKEDTLNPIRVNHMAPEDYYGIARLNAEAKHRAFHRLRIVDLRVFSYFSRFIDLTDGYFMTDLLDCILKKKVLVTDSVNMVRDYLHPEDLFSMILKCIHADEINAAFDVFSAKPVRKNQILNYFSSQYGLKYEIRESLIKKSATGSKSIYCSKYNGASQTGYIPKFTSMETLKEESKYILSKTDVR
jgi:nucleoside-diphosphate-sugar epimerase